MNKWILIFLTPLVFSGCANLDYANKLKPEDMLYQAKNYSDTSKTTAKLNLTSEYINIGSDKSGYIGADNSELRKEFDAKFPLIAHDKQALDSISDSHNHRVRLGQALVFAADLDKRTSGYLKDGNGVPISISGKFQPNASSAMTQGVTSGVVIGAASGVMAVNSMNSQLAQSGLKLSETGTSAVAGGQMAQGLIAGLLAGGIHAALAESAVKEIISAKNFGEMMQGTTLTAAHLLPGMGALGPDGLIRTSVPVVIGPGVVKRYFLKFNQKTLNYKNQYVLITAVGTYRGKNYENAYPNTLGWNYHISNMSVLELNADEGDDAEKSFYGIRREIRAMNLM